MRFFKNLFLSIVLILITSCSDDVYIWNEADRVMDYSKTLVGHNVQLVDHLDRILRACEYREQIIAGKDGQIILDRYFSDECWRLLYNEELDELTVTMGTPEVVGYLSIIHSGKSILESGTKYTINGRLNRFWYHETQPQYKEYTFTIENDGNAYKLNGDLIINGLWEEFFTECTFDYTFSIDQEIIYDNTSVNGKPDERPVWEYLFNGSYSVKNDGRVDFDHKERPSASVTVIDLEGYNHNEYYMGIPIFSSGYFSKGVISAVYGTGKDAMDLRLNINGGSWKAVFNGTEYTLY